MTENIKSLEDMQFEPVFRVKIYVELDGEVFHGYCSELDCIHVCGDSIEEAVDAATDAVYAYLKLSFANGDPIPIGIHVEGATTNHEVSHTKRREFVEDVKLVHT